MTLNTHKNKGSGI